MYRILALETASQPGAAALLEGDQLRWEERLPGQQRTTESLLPALQRGLEQIGWKPTQVDAIAVCRGPGSFTGLRIGMMTAKTWTYASGARLVAVNTLQLLAHQVFTQLPQPAPIAAVMDAQRGEWFAALFEPAALAPEQVAAAPPVIVQIVSPETWLRQLDPHSIVTGPVLAAAPAELLVGRTLADPEFWQPQPGALGRLAHARLLHGLVDDPWSLQPDYYRPSAAEQRWREK